MNPAIGCTPGGYPDKLGDRREDVRSLRLMKRMGHTSARVPVGVHAMRYALRASTE